MATKKDKKAADPKATDTKAEEKAAKRKARMEALKNRPAVQRPNSKQIDVIECPAGIIKNYGYAIKNRSGYQGVLVTSVVENKEGEVVNTSVTFIPGNLTVKSKKGHGVITSPKSKKEKDEEGEEEEKED